MATEDERYRQSTQYRLWSFSPAGLQELRQRTNSMAKQQIAARLASPTAASGTAAAAAPPSTLPEFLTPEEEARLVRFFTVELMRAAQFCELPTEIRSTAAVFLRRFYATNSVMTYPPTELLKTALFFGCKAEGFHVGLARLADKFPDTTGEQILAGEFLLCQGIRFAFDVRHPLRALEGAILRLRRVLLAVDSSPPSLDNKDAEDKQQEQDVQRARARARIDAAHRRAREILKFSAIVTDAYFHYAPSQIMMAALLIADAGLVDVLMPLPEKASCEKDADATATQTQTALRNKIFAALEACKKLLEEEPPERMVDYWGTPETVKSMKPLRKKLQKCRDPDRANLVALQRARREQALAGAKKPNGVDGAGMVMDGHAQAQARHIKRRKLESADDVFGPSIG